MPESGSEQSVRQAGEQPADAREQRNAASEEAADILKRVLGAEGVQTLRKTKILSTTAMLGFLSIVADLIQVFGNFNLILISGAAVVAIVLALIVALRIRGYGKCVSPLITAVLAVMVFTFVSWGQALAGAEDGLLVKGLGEIRQRLSNIETAQHETTDELRNLTAQVDALTKAYAAQNPALDVTSIEAYRNAVTALLTSGDARKLEALETYNEGLEEDDTEKRQEAIASLKTLARDQSRTIEKSSAQAAETWLQVGALAFSEDTQTALEAYQNAVELSPDDLSARIQLSTLFIRTGQLAKAEDELRAILGRTAGDDTFRTAFAYRNLGIIEGEKGNIDAAEKYHLLSKEHFEEGGYAVGVAMSFISLGHVELDRGRLERAAELFEQGYSWSDKIDYRPGKASSLGSLGKVELIRGNWDLAETYIARTLVIFDELGDRLAMADTLANWGLVEHGRKNLPQAVEYAEASLHLYEQLNHKSGTSRQLNNLAIFAREQRHFGMAAEYHQRSLTLDREMGNQAGVASNLMNLGINEMDLENYETARTYFEESRSLYEQLGHPAGVSRAWANLAVLEQRQGHMDTYCLYLANAVKDVPPNDTAALSRNVRERLKTSCSGQTP